MELPTTPARPAESALPLQVAIEGLDPGARRREPPPVERRHRPLVNFLALAQGEFVLALAFVNGDEACFQIASMYALRKEPNEMFAWLDRAYAVNDLGLPQLLIAPFLNKYRDDPRFTALWQKIKLPARQLGTENLPPKS